MFGTSNTQQPFGQPGTTSGGGLFGSTQSQGLFGKPVGPATTAPQTGLFGTTTGSFFQPSASGTGLFQQQPQQQQAPAASGFSQPATGGLFGSPTKPLFGGPTTSTTTGFGATSNAPTLFGQPQVSTGAGMSLFGQPASTTTSLFGGQAGGTTATAAPTGGLFGNPATATAGSTGQGLFGTQSATGTTGGVFGQAGVTPTTSLFGQAAAQTSPQQQGQTSSLFGSAGGGGSALFASGSNQFGLTGPIIGTSTVTEIEKDVRECGKALTVMANMHFTNPAKPLTQVRFEDYLLGRKPQGVLMNMPVVPQGTGASTVVGGAPATGTSTSGLFGTPQQQQQSTSLFGTTTQQQQQQPSMFGGTSSLFNRPATTTPTTTTTTTGLFGAPASPQPGTTSTTGGLFGQPQQTTSSGLFGQTSQQPSTTGAGSLLFGSTTQPQQQPSAFSTTGSTGLFGTTTTQQPSTTGLFGSTQPATGGTTSTGLFGDMSLFGKQQPQPAAQQQQSLFGTAQQPTSSLFGTTTGTSLFGTAQQQQPATTSSLFGPTTPAPGTASTTGGLFGTAAQQQPAPATGLFGTTGLFGSMKPTTQTTGLFGTVTQPGGTGVTSQQQPQGSLFSQPSSLFSTTASPSTSLFSTPSNLFATKPATDSNLLFQQQLQQQAAAPTLMGGAGIANLSCSIVDPYGLSRLSAALLPRSNPYPLVSSPPKQSLQSQLPIGYGFWRQLPKIVGSSNSMYDMGILTACGAHTAPGYGNTSLVSYTKSRHLNTVCSRTRQLILSSIGDETSVDRKQPSAPSTSRGIQDVRSSFAEQGLDTLNLTISIPKTRMTADIPSGTGAIDQEAERDISWLLRSSSRQTQGEIKHHRISTPPSSSTPCPTRRGNVKQQQISDDEKSARGTSSISTPRNVTCRSSVASQGVTQRAIASTAHLVGSSPRSKGHALVSTASSSSGGQVSKNPLAPRLTRPDYSTRPSIEALEMYSNVQLSNVEDFTICRAGYGECVWPGFTDVRNLDLDAIVDIEERSIEVYGSRFQSQSGDPLPVVGEGLNKTAIITLENCKPPSEMRGNESESEFIERYIEIIRKYTKDIDATFMSLSTDSWQWKFRVEHFSKYSVPDMTNDENRQPCATNKPQVKSLAVRATPQRTWSRNASVKKSALLKKKQAAVPKPAVPTSEPPYEWSGNLTQFFQNVVLSQPSSFNPSDTVFTYLQSLRGGTHPFTESGEQQVKTFSSLKRKKAWFPMSTALNADLMSTVKRKKPTLPASSSSPIESLLVNVCSLFLNPKQRLTGDTVKTNILESLKILRSVTPMTVFVKELMECLRLLCLHMAGLPKQEALRRWLSSIAKPYMDKVHRAHKSSNSGGISECLDYLVIGHNKKAVGVARQHCLTRLAGLINCVSSPLSRYYVGLQTRAFSKLNLVYNHSTGHLKCLMLISGIVDPKALENELNLDWRVTSAIHAIYDTQSTRDGGTQSPVAAAESAAQESSFSGQFSRFFMDEIKYIGHMVNYVDRLLEEQQSSSETSSSSFVTAVGSVVVFLYSGLFLCGLPCDKCEVTAHEAMSALFSHESNAASHIQSIFSVCASRIAQQVTPHVWHYGVLLLLVSRVVNVIPNSETGGESSSTSSATTGSVSVTFPESLNSITQFLAKHFVSLDDHTVIDLIMAPILESRLDSTAVEITRSSSLDMSAASVSEILGFFRKCGLTPMYLLECLARGFETVGDRNKACMCWLSAALESQNQKSSTTAVEESGGVSSWFSVVLEQSRWSGVLTLNSSTTRNAYMCANWLITKAMDHCCETVARIVHVLANILMVPTKIQASTVNQTTCIDQTISTDMLRMFSAFLRTNVFDDLTTEVLDLIVSPDFMQMIEAVHSVVSSCPPQYSCHNEWKSTGMVFAVKFFDWMFSGMHVAAAYHQPVPSCSSTTTSFPIKMTQVLSLKRETSNRDLKTTTGDFISMSHKFLEFGNSFFAKDILHHWNLKKAQSSTLCPAVWTKIHSTVSFILRKYDQMMKELEMPPTTTTIHPIHSDQ